MSISKITTYLACLLSMTGCDFIDCEDDPEVLASYPEQGVLVIGTNDNQINEAAIIDPYVQNGEFFITFNPSQRQPLHFNYKLYLSSNTDNYKEVLLYSSQICDVSTLACFNNTSNTIYCQFFPDMTGDCEDQYFDLNGIIRAIPSNAHITAETCPKEPGECNISTIMVTIR